MWLCLTFSLIFFLCLPFFFKWMPPYLEKNSRMKKAAPSREFYNISTVIPESLTEFCWYLLQVPSSRVEPRKPSVWRDNEEIKVCLSVPINTLNLPLSGERGTGLLRTLTTKVVHWNYYKGYNLLLCAPRCHTPKILIPCFVKKKKTEKKSTF